MQRTLMYAFLAATLLSLLSCQSTPFTKESPRRQAHHASHGKAANTRSEAHATPPTMRVKWSSPSEVRDIPKRWTWISSTGTRNVQSDETSYSLTFNGVIPLGFEWILLSRPAFELVQVIDESGRRLLATLNESTYDDIRRYVERGEERLSRWFEYYRHHHADGWRHELSLSVDSLDYRPKGIARVVAKVVVDVALKTRTTTIDLQKALTEPVDLGDGLHMVAQMEENQSGSRERIRITFRFEVTEKAWEAHSHPALLDLDLLDASGSDVEEVSMYVRGYGIEHGLQITTTVALDEQASGVAKVRLTLAPDVERRVIKLVGENFRVP